MNQRFIASRLNANRHIAWAQSQLTCFQSPSGTVRKTLPINSNKTKGMQSLPQGVGYPNARAIFKISAGTFFAKIRLFSTAPRTPLFLSSVL
jgi:hypothetical protein